jgi:hypothetical protein
MIPRFQYGIFGNVVLSIMILMVITAGGALSACSISAQAQPESGVTSAEVERLRQQLQSSDLDEILRQSLEEKLMMAERQAEEQAAGLANPASKDKNQLASAPQVTDPEPLSGLFEGGDGYFHPWQMTVVNHWIGNLKGEHTVIYAGSLGEDPLQGVLVVLTVQGDTGETRQVSYLTPEKLGALRIVEVKEDTVVLTTTDGVQMLFDLINRKFNP